jgi:hypothetical protein
VQRYNYTYWRKTNDWNDDADLGRMLDGLTQARAAGGATLRAFIDKTFDVPLVLTYMAIRNWSGAWDDDIHNHLLYQRATDGKWLVTPTDFDQEFGTVPATFDPNAARTPMSTLYMGEQNNPENHLGWNLIKDAVFKVYRAEFDARVTELARTLLATDNVIKLVDEGAGLFNMADWMAAPTAKSCDVQGKIEKIRQWARARTPFVLQRPVP